jgi:hypothetical protein
MEFGYLRGNGIQIFDSRLLGQILEFEALIPFDQFVK